MDLLDDDMVNTDDFEPKGYGKWLATLLEGVPLFIIIFGLFLRYRRMTGESTLGFTPELIIAVGACIAGIVYLLFTHVLFPRQSAALIDKVAEGAFRICLFVFMIWLGLSFYSFSLPFAIIIIGGFAATCCILSGGFILTQSSDQSARREWALKLLSRALAVSFLIFIMN